MIGSRDRALGRKARVHRPVQAEAPAPRVISPQNRMRMTQSPCRASLPQANTLNPQPKNLSDNLLSHEGNPRSRTALNHTPASNRVKSPFKLRRNQATL